MQRLRYFLWVFTLVIIACADEKKYHDSQEKVILNTATDKLASIMQFQKELNEEFKDPEVSPLPDRYRKDFEGLDFFKPDTNYVIEAKFTRTPDAIPFLMPTTTDRESEEVVYGIAQFKLDGKEFSLEIYQNPELTLKDGYEDYLFLPFTDNSNGTETYGGGRYLDLRIPDDNVIVLDFNKAYNPYCVYNKKYSCPLVPRVNNLDTKVMAGVRDFKKE